MPHKKVGCLRMRKQYIPGPFSGPGYEARAIVLKDEETPDGKVTYRYVKVI